MDDSLLDYYERELTFIREMGAEFARKYPKIAGRLLLEPDRCEDPHTERLIEAFAFISGRIFKKIDDDFPEITASLLNIIYPHYTSPIPSMSVVKFEPVKKTTPPTGYLIPQNTQLFSKPIGGAPCHFRTSYPVTLWPMEVVSANFQEPEKLMAAQQAIAIRLKTFNNLNLSQIEWKKLRFFLNGPSQHIYHLYELLMNNVSHVECEPVSQRRKQESISLNANAIEPVGFEPHESVLPFSPRSFPGYLLLFEYFCFPEKFLFFDLAGLEKTRRWDFTDTLDIRIYLNKAAKSNTTINQDTFAINATPVVNLFQRLAEPLRVEHRKPEYHVLPDVRRQESTEVFSVDRVTSSLPSSPGDSIEFSPFYSLRHHIEEDDRIERKAFWHIERRDSGKKGDNGTEVFISFADLKLKPADPEVEIMTVHVTCTNRDLPARLPFGDPAGDFNMELVGPVAQINSLMKPTPTRRPSLGGALHWRLISHLSLNYLSLVQGGAEALREILTLYDFDDSPATRQQIGGIVSLRSEYVTKRVGQAFGRGVQVTLEFDEDKFVGTGLYLFANVLERFLGQYVSVNSFSQLIAKTIQKGGVLKKWQPRNGNRILL